MVECTSFGRMIYRGACPGHILYICLLTMIAVFCFFSLSFTMCLSRSCISAASQIGQCSSSRLTDVCKKANPALSPAILSLARAPGFLKPQANSFCNSDAPPNSCNKAFSVPVCFNLVPHYGHLWCPRKEAAYSHSFRTGPDYLSVL